MTWELKLDFITRHNVDIKITHHKGKAMYYPDLPWNLTFFQHSLKVYVHDMENYVINTGVQMLLPKQPHDVMCANALLEIDVPIRTDAPSNLKEFTETILHQVVQMTQNLDPIGISVVDQRETRSLTETKVKVIIGTPMAAITLPTGYRRKAVLHHGTRFLETKEEEEAESDLRSDQNVVIEIDEHQEAPRSYREASGTSNYYHREKQVAVTQEAPVNPSQPMTQPIREGRIPSIAQEMSGKATDSDRILIWKENVKPRTRGHYLDDKDRGKRPEGSRLRELKIEHQRDAARKRAGSP